MSLTIEDGTIVEDADSYATVAELRAYATKRGATLPAEDGPGDAACEVLLIVAMDWLAAQSERWKGVKVAQDQPLDWPRDGVVVGGYELPSDAIPEDLKRGQMQLAIDAQTLELQPTIDAAGQVGPVVREKVDVLEVQYAAPTAQRSVSWFAKASGFLDKYFSAGAGQVKLVRG